MTKSLQPEGWVNAKAKRQRVSWFLLKQVLVWLLGWKTCHLPITRSSLPVVEAISWEPVTATSLSRSSKQLISCSGNTCQWIHSEHKTLAFQELTSIIKLFCKRRSWFKEGRAVKIMKSVSGSGLLLQIPYSNQAVSRGRDDCRAVCAQVYHVPFCPVQKCNILQAMNLSSVKICLVRGFVCWVFSLNQKFMLFKLVNDSNLVSPFPGLLPHSHHPQFQHFNLSVFGILLCLVL